MPLRGRSAECAHLERLLTLGGSGQSASLVICGEPGVGKTALLEYASTQANGWHVFTATGVEAEMELPFAGLHQLCSGLMDGADRLPRPQQQALATAFGLTSGTRPEKFLVGLAVLNLLAEAATVRPVLCVIDDAQWLDQSSTQVLGFVARRLKAESLVMLFTQRDPAACEELSRIPQLRLQGIPEEFARELLASVVNGPLDAEVRGRILAEAHGNPLALMELPQEYFEATLAGGSALPGRVALPHRLKASFRRRVRRLPAPTQQLLLIAAAEPTGAPALLWRAAAVLGIPLAAAAPAEAEGLIALGAQTTFRHSLLRSTIYESATEQDRRDAHRALAAATDARVDPDRHAWHRAYATPEPDEDVAAEMERSAARAQARGGLAASASFLERAAALTPDDGPRARRALMAARAKQLCGVPEAALALASAAVAGPLAELDLALAQRLRGQIALDLRHGGEAVPLLLAAARQLETLDPGLARETYTEALRAASIAGRLGDSLPDVAQAARRAPRPAGAPGPVDLLLDGLAVRFTDGYVASAPALRQALHAVLEAGVLPGQDPRWPWAARRVAPDLFDDHTWHAVATHGVQIARAAGALAVLPLALSFLASWHIWTGDLDEASGLIEEAETISEATGSEPILFTPLLLAGWRGDEDAALPLLRAKESAALIRGEGIVLTYGEQARAVLYNGLGKYEAALQPALNASKQNELMASAWSLPELIEAASRIGRADLATTALEALSEIAGAAGTDLALGIEARSRALLSAGDPADALYRRSIELLGHTRHRVALARAHLLYGEWLRRDRRRTDAREQLRTAHEMFTQMGMAAFAERSRRELVATGETVRKRTDAAPNRLTAQETQIARLAAEGHTNPEIGTTLFLSGRTVEWHLRKIYLKLDITSRRQVREALSGSTFTTSH